jgi:hypothetical protein
MLELISKELCAAIPLFGYWVFKRVLAPEKERAKKKKEKRREKKVKGIELLFSCIPCCLGV